MTSTRAFCLSLLLVATAFACSAPDTVSGDPAPSTPNSDDPSGQLPVPPADADGGGSVAADGDNTGKGDVTKKTDGEPEIESWSWQAVFKENLFLTYLSANVPSMGHLAHDIRIKNPASEKKTVIARASLQGYTKSETPVTIVLQPGEVKTIWLDAALDFDALSKLSSPVPSAITVTLSVDGQTVYSADASVKVIPKNQVFWQGVFKDTTLGGKAAEGTREKIAVVGAMTTPHDKDGYVDQLLQQAAQLTDSKSLSGYQNIGSNTTVDQAGQIVGLQAKAIYDALHNMGMNYTSVTQDFFSSQNGQNVRFPAESLRAKTANCIDGALVFASAFDSLGIEADVVFVPGHAFVGFHLGPSGTSLYNQMVFIETTVVRNQSYEAANQIGLANINETYAGKWTRIPVAAARNAYGFVPFPM